jgi:hypothetical protein
MSQLPGQPLYGTEKEDKTNPVSEVEGLFGIRMTKAQKWAWVIGLTAALWGITYYTSKKK